MYRVIAFLIQTCILMFVLSNALAESIDPQPTSDETEAFNQMITLLDSLDKRTGEINLGDTGASLNVPEEFYFLDANDAKRVLVEAWGNPPGSSVLGMLFPSNVTPFDDDSWAVTIEYEEDGFVSDEDADEINYDELLEGMKEDTRAASEERVTQGYEAIALVGWASPPYYDAATKKLHWAKEISFDGHEINTLNYNIRVLGRKGVLVLNFVAGMNQKPTIESNLEAVLALADFDQGSKYTDFNPDLDEVAAYGLGALVAGKVIAKTGFIAVALVFLKKFGIVIVLALAAMVKGLFSRKKKTS